MTQYFDAKAKTLSDLRSFKGLESLTRALEQLDSEVVWDVSICSELKGFPDDLRVRMNQVVLKYSAACTPVNKSGPCYEDAESHVNGLLNMVGDLHTIFHELCERNLTGFSDDPRTPLRILYSASEERREDL